MRTSYGRIFIVLLWVLLGLHLQTRGCPAADMPPAEGSALPDFSLPVSPSEEDNQYLGVAQKDFFKVPQIQGDIVILEVFNMYCPHCQREAPNINQLYNILSGRQSTQTRIRILGIGAGNSPFEVNTFKRVFSVPFPLFPDNDYSIHKAFCEVRTPYFIGIRINSDGTHKVIYSKVGGIGDPEQFLQLILKQSKLE